MMLSTLALALTTVYGRGGFWNDIFRDGTPGFRINVEEALRLNQQALGPELFDGNHSTGWSFGSGITTTPQRLTFTAATTANSCYRPLLTLGKSYVVSFRVENYVSGNVQAIASSGLTTAGRTGNGRFVEFIVPTAAAGNLGFKAATLSFTGDVILESVREIDLSKCVAFQDSAGTLPVVGVEQPLGLVLDTKLGVPMVGPELVSNGGFDSDAGWTKDPGWTIASGVATKTAGAQSFLDTLSPSSFVTGRFYRLSISCTRSAGSLYVYIRGALAVQFTSGSNAAGGTITVCVPAGSSSVTGLRIDGDASFVGSVDNISVREVPGVHFVQPSNTASRPIVSRRVNLLNAPKDFASGSWTKNGSTTATQSTISFPNESQSVAQLVTTPAPQGASATFSVELSGTPGQTVTVGLARAGSGALEESRTTVTLTSEYQRYSATLTIANANQTGFIPYITRTAGQTALSVNARNADLRYSFDLIGVPPFQDVRSSTDYDEVGFPAYARADGLDDWLESGVVDMSGTDAVTVIAGVTKLSDAARGIVVELGNGAVPGSDFNMNAPPSASPGYGFRSRGTSIAGADLYTGFPAPTTDVLTGIGDISGDQVALRVNGVQAASSSADQGTGNYGAHKFFLLRRGGTSLPFNGRLYGVTVIGKLLTDSQLAAAEQAERQIGRLY